MSPPRSILIVRLSAIGDVIHALPVLAELRRQLPDARIGWIVEEVSAPLLRGHPQLDKLYVIPRRPWRGRSLARKLFPEVLPYFRSVAADGWDAALDLQGLTKSALAALGSRAALRVGFAGADGREASRLLNTRTVLPPPGAVHVVQRNLSLLEGIGLRPDLSARGIVHVECSERDAMAASLRGLGWAGERLVALNPGAGWVTKRWPAEEFAQLAHLLHGRNSLRPVVVWGPGEEALVERMLAGMDGLAPIVAPRTGLRELAALLSLMDVFVGGDTGPTHLAAALGIRTLAVFGASDPVRNGPWPALPHVSVVQRGDLACVPCWKTKCPLSGAAHLACLRELSPGVVAAALR